MSDSNRHMRENYKFKQQKKKRKQKFNFKQEIKTFKDALMKFPKNEEKDDS